MVQEASLGRFCRSLRPQADLKAAAIGAVVLLREWVQDKRDQTARRRQDKIEVQDQSQEAVVEREPPPRVVALVERYPAAPGRDQP